MERDHMLTDQEIMDIVADTMGPFVLLENTAHMAYMMKAVQNPFVRHQIDIGIYNAMNILTDFLSPMASFPKEGVVSIDCYLIRKHMDGVADDLARAYVKRMALHEKAHFDCGHEPADNPQEQALHELECHAKADVPPDVNKLAEEAEAQSAVYRRVMRRMRNKQTKIITDLELPPYAG
jgi:hypothetical protein